jgi:single-strand DNA-binding protein
MNVVHLKGNLGKAPEVHTFGNGDKKASFSLATTKKYKKDGETVKKTEWHNIAMYRNLALLAEKYLDKGSSIIVEGEITYREYEKDGQKKYFTEIVANKMHFLSDGNKATSSQEEYKNPITEKALPETDSRTGQSNKNINGDDSDDLPF